MSTAVLAPISTMPVTKHECGSCDRTFTPRTNTDSNCYNCNDYVCRKCARLYYDTENDILLCEMCYDAADHQCVDCGDEGTHAYNGTGCGVEWWCDNCWCPCVNDTTIEQVAEKTDASTECKCGIFWVKIPKVLPEPVRQYFQAQLDEDLKRAEFPMFGDATQKYDTPEGYADIYMASIDVKPVREVDPDWPEIVYEGKCYTLRMER